MSREVMQQALEALTEYDGTNGESKRKRVLAALREMLAQQEQEPVKFNCTVVDDDHPEGVPLSQWGRQPLTEAAIRGMCERVPNYDISTHDLIQFARAIEQAHGIKEKNT